MTSFTRTLLAMLVVDDVIHHNGSFSGICLIQSNLSFTNYKNYELDFSTIKQKIYLHLFTKEHFNSHILNLRSHTPGLMPPRARKVVESAPPRKGVVRRRSSTAPLPGAAVEVNLNVPVSELEQVAVLIKGGLPVTLRHNLNFARVLGGMAVVWNFIACTAANLFDSIGLGASLPQVFTEQDGDIKAIWSALRSRNCGCPIVIGQIILAEADSRRTFRYRNVSMSGEMLQFQVDLGPPMKLYVSKYTLVPNAAQIQMTQSSPPNADDGEFSGLLPVRRHKFGKHSISGNSIVKLEWMAAVMDREPQFARRLSELYCSLPGGVTPTETGVTISSIITKRERPSNRQVRFAQPIPFTAPLRGVEPIRLQGSGAADRTLGGRYGGSSHDR